MKNKILFAASLLFGLMFINSGLNKFFHYMPMPKDMPESAINLFTAFMSIGWLMSLIAVVEIIGGLLFILPKYRAIAALMIFPILVGIVLTHIVNIPSGLPMAIALMGIELWVIFENRQKYLSILN